MDFKFEKFEGRNKREEDRITITQSESIGLPTKFYNENGIKNFKYGVLFFDKGNNAIGIQFTNNEAEKSKFSLMKSKDGYGASIIARSFFKVNNIDAKKYRGRYEWSIVSIGGVGELYVISLKEHEEKKD